MKISHFIVIMPNISAELKKIQKLKRSSFLQNSQQQARIIEYCIGFNYPETGEVHIISLAPINFN